MKSVIIKINDDLEFDYIDKDDERAIKALFSSMLRKGINKAVMTITLVENKASEKQEKLFNVLVSKVAQESGQDSNTIREEFLKDFETKIVRDLSHEQFQQLLESSCAITQEIFGFSVSFDKHNNIQIRNY